jgi:hypothetical protein
VLVQRPRDGRRKQHPRVAGGKPVDRQLGQTAELVDLAGLADGEHHGDPLRQQTPRDEGQRLRGGLIKPLRVVDEAHERLHLGRSGQQAEGREGEQEAIGGGADLHPERDSQGVALWAGQRLQSVEQGCAQLM